MKEQHKLRLENLSKTNEGIYMRIYERGRYTGLLDASIFILKESKKYASKEVNDFVNEVITELKKEIK